MSVASICSACGADLPDGARFCPACGQPVSSEVAIEERRIVTVVFADLQGFTALAEHRDPESVKELLDACFDALVPVIESHGGHVDKIIGDELMGLFGAPISHEDDADRAVRAALQLAPALAAVDPALRLCVGVNTGEVLAGSVGPSQGYTVTGDVVNTAHRLVSAAGPGEVLVGDRTRQATDTSVDYELRGDLDLRGKQDRVRAWVASGIRDRTATVGANGLVAQLIGRAQPLGECEQQIALALAEGRPEVITVVGEPGVGKTRLAMELASKVTAPPVGARILWISCPPYGPGGDLGPLAELVRLGLGIGTSVARDAQEQRLSENVADLARATGADGRLLRDRLGMLLGLGHRATRSVASETGPNRAGAIGHQLGAVRTVLAHLAAQQPLLVIADDLHWASDTVLRFLAQVPEQLTDLPVVVLGLARDDLLERRPQLVGGGPGRSTRSLGPLSAAATADLAMALLEGHAAGPGASRVGPATLERLVASSGGNPLLLEQLVGYLVETGALVDIDGRWQWTTAEAGVDPSLPDGIRSLIGARLDGLPADEKGLLSAAAVFGRRFWRQALVDLTELPEPAEVLDRAVARGLVHPVTDEGTGDHAFHHVLTRDVAYAALPISDRASRHAQFAAWLDRTRQVGEAASAPTISLRAHHYERAVVLARSVDHTDPGLAVAAFDALERAARDEAARGGFYHADQWYRRARDLGTMDIDGFLDLVIAHGQVLLELRHLDDASEAFEEVLRRTAGHDEAREATALAHLGAVSRLAGDVDVARERFEAATVRWREIDDVQGQIDTLRLQGWADITAGRFRAALPRLERAASMEEQSGAVARRSETLRYLGWCEFLSGQAARAQQHLWEAMSQGEGTDQGTLGWCFGLLAFTMLQAGQIERSLEVSQNLRAVAIRNSDAWGEWTSATLEAAGLLGLGRTAEAAQLAGNAEWHLEELGDPWGLALARVVAAQAARHDGDTALARAVLQRAIASSRVLTYVGEDARLLAELSRVELDAGDEAEADRLARSALALVRAGIGDHESGLRCLVVLAEVARRRGATRDAELLLEEAAGTCEPEDRTDGWRQAAVSLATIRLASGDVTGASALVAAAQQPPTQEVRIVAAITELSERLRVAR